MEKALDRLRHDGVIISWLYVTRPNEKIAGRKGWSEAWGLGQVQIEPPQAIVEQYDKINQTLPGKKGLAASKK